ncbi:hypothetical protein ACFPL7_03580 [Dongia soli]|uniref:Uncharacterized protein n=1 Tax=Dongia soli TaxID=600628 RepID=A0ABU5EGS9_9PROT|nr:hypothetical protein [Dongia soli]MDY0884628.1 hypothetical protein [Dongia soli]
MTKKTPLPKTQFPADPNRAAEAGYTYGWAAPEKPGKRMATPPLTPPEVPPSAVERDAARQEAKEIAAESHNRELEEKLTDEAEKIGPRGNFKK